MSKSMYNPIYCLTLPKKAKHVVTNSKVAGWRFKNSLKKNVGVANVITADQHPRSNVSFPNTTGSLLSYILGR